MRWLLFTAAVTSLLHPRDASAQRGRELPMIGVGTRVRVGVVDVISRSPFASKAQRLQGTVRVIAAETLYVDLSNTVGAVAIPREAIQGVEMSLGRPSRSESAAGVGAVSAVLCALFLPSFVPHADRYFGSGWRGNVASAGIGFGAGALIGALRPYEHWRTSWIPE
jgi:hypothetical protein